MVAALKEPVEDSEDENEDNLETEGDGPLWKLFDQLYNSPNASGMCVNKLLLTSLLIYSKSNKYKNSVA